MPTRWLFGLDERNTSRHSSGCARIERKRISRTRASQGAGLAGDKHHVSGAGARRLRALPQTADGPGPSTGLGLRLSRVLDRGHRRDLAAMAWVARGPRVHRPPRRPFGANARPLPGTDPLGGGRGIRTLDTVSRIHAFQACAFSRSATPPAPAGCRIRAHYSQGGEADNSQSRRVRRKSSALRDDPGIKQATRSRNAAAPGLAVAIDSWCPCASGL